MNVINELESEVRSYCRDYPAVFQRAKGCHLYDVDGKEYLDFFAGAGALNYGHNPPDMQRALLGYITQDGITHSLDKATAAKTAFLKRFNEVILKPRGMNYKVQFPGPTGTNAVEAALKLARKVTGRNTIIGFTNAFHGMTLGSLSVTGNGFKREGAGVPLTNTVSMPYEGFLGDETDTIEFLDAYIRGNGSGVSLPAAIILETVQAEGGLHTASKKWLRGVQAICRKHEILLIVDDVQAGCGRTGSFFSFEEAGLDPDLICLSKSISGYGLPMALTLIRPELDQWAPGEHNGTFRGHNLAFITATEALARWETDELSEHVMKNAAIITDHLEKAARDFPALEGEVRGRGMIQGLACVPGVAEKVLEAAFKRGLIMETSGPDSEVVKILPSLVIEEEELKQGLKIVRECLSEVARTMKPAAVTRQSA